MKNINKILPNKNSEFKGNKISYYFFGIVTLVSLVRSLIHMFSPDGGAQSIASIPLDQYSNNAADTIILIFAYWGISQLLLVVINTFVFFKYKNFIPFLYLIMIAEYLLRLLLANLKPIITEQTAPGAIGNYILIPLLIIMFFLSIKTKR